MPQSCDCGFHNHNHLIVNFHNHMIVIVNVCFSDDCDCDCGFCPTRNHNHNHNHATKQIYEKNEIMLEHREKKTSPIERTMRDILIFNFISLTDRKYDSIMGESKNCVFDCDPIVSVTIA